MQRNLKFILIFISIILGLVCLDTLVALVFNNSPILRIREKLSDDSYVDKGLVINTYKCHNNKKTLFKWVKYACSVKESKKEIKEIIDLVAKDNLSCDMALDKFYQDENYIYSYNCIKSDKVIVKYNDGSKEIVRDALQNNRITIQDLDRFNISYIKEANINEKEPQKIAGISMTIKEGSLTNKSAIVIIKDTNGKGTYAYGTPFRVDKKENGKWVTLKEISDNCAFTLEAYYVDDNGLLEFNQDWECMYGELEKGTYRLVKYTFLNSDAPVTDDDHRYFSVEFTIK